MADSEEMTTQVQTTRSYPDKFKIPESYDFSTRGKNWSEYHGDFLLRTDAIWEKEKLRDWFRLYQKCFYFDRSKNQYLFIEPEDIYTILYEGWALEDLTPFVGFNPTGRTTNFQVGQGPKQREAVSAQLNFIHADYWELYTYFLIANSHNFFQQVMF